MQDFDELAGRVDGVAQAVVHLAAMLEMAGLIDGPALSSAWRGARRASVLPALETARVTLQEMAQALDDGRAVRASLRSAEPR